VNHDSTAYSPSSLAEAYAILAERAGTIKIIAGGTDLMVLMNARMLDAAEFLDIWRIDELRGVTDEGDLLRIGSLATYTELINSPLIQNHAPSLVAASRTIGAIQIQNRGTIGGNIVNASPAGDSLPVLAAYDAEIEIGSARGLRRVSFNEFYKGYRSTVLEPDEMVLAVRIPKLKENERDFFWKVGTRRAQAISKTVLASKAAIKDGVIQSISISVGSVAPTVIRAPMTEKMLSSKQLTLALIKEASESLANEISPITDLRSTEHYRRTVTGNVLAKFLRRIRSTDSLE
jgi:xanthine dehydrogenase small subunit